MYREQEKGKPEDEEETRRFGRKSGVTDRGSAFIPHSVYDGILYAD